jgi:hypothetical protein
MTASINVGLMEAAPSCRPPPLSFNRDRRFVDQLSVVALGTLEAGKNCARQRHLKIIMY